MLPRYRGMATLTITVGVNVAHRLIWVGRIPNPDYDHMCEQIALVKPRNTHVMNRRNRKNQESDNGKHHDNGRYNDRQEIRRNET